MIRTTTRVRFPIALYMWSWPACKAHACNGLQLSAFVQAPPSFILTAPRALRVPRGMPESTALLWQAHASGRAQSVSSLDCLAHVRLPSSSPPSQTATYTAPAKFPISLKESQFPGFADNDTANAPFPGAGGVHGHGQTAVNPMFNSGATGTIGHGGHGARPRKSLTMNRKMSDLRPEAFKKQFAGRDDITDASADRVPTVC